MISPGSVVDSAYRIVGVPREGGMAEIYRAVRIKDGRRVALKILKEEFRNQGDALGRLNHEEEIGLLLNHKNIIRVYPHEGEKSFPYIVAEFIEGPTLAEFIDRHRWLALQTALKITMQLIDASEYMHSLGVIHQDLKPENIVVLKSGEIKIIDFGLAYYSGSKNVAWKNMLSIGGTPAYMPPQRMNGDITSGTDVYSIGVILYRMVTGRLPYTEQEIAAYSKGQAPDIKARRPGSYNKNIHPRLEAVIMRSIALEKKDRYFSATALGYALAKVAKQSIGYKKKEIDWLLISFLVLMAAAIYIGIRLLLLYRSA